MDKKSILYRSLLSLSIVACVLFAALTTRASATEPMDESHDVQDRVEFEYLLPDSRELIDTSANVIIDDAHTLEPLMAKLSELRKGGDGVVSILHIGDSHLQADIWSGRVRYLLQREFGNAGRGLITPYKLTGSNEPRDYGVQTSLNYFTYKATERGLKEMPGLTGVAVAFEGQKAKFRLWSKSFFNAVTILHHADAPMLDIETAFDPGINCTSENTLTSTRLVLSELTDTLNISGVLSEKFNNPTFYGFSLENGQPGVLYHMIGLNGAAFEHIGGNTNLLDGGADVLNPDLIIVSLGTNNCFGSGYRSEQFRGVAERFISRLTGAYQGVPVLMTTPMESCRRASRRAAYRVNANVADVASIIKDVSAEHGVACWDMYGAAGGENSNARWYDKKLIRDDRIHFSEQGYLMIGDMMYEALAEYYNQWQEKQNR